MGGNFLADHAHAGEIFRAVSEPRSVGDLTPARRAFEPERDQFGDLFNDFGKGTGAVNVLQDATAPALDVGGCGGVLPCSALNHPRSCAHRQQNQQQQSDKNSQVAHGEQ